MKTSPAALAIVLTCWLASHAWPAEKLTAVIEGPASAAPGDLVVLDAGSSIGAQKFVWTLVDSDKKFLAVDNGQRVVFASGKPAVYTFLLAVAGLDAEGKADVALVRHTLVIGAPTPKPVIPLNPAAVKAVAALQGFRAQSSALAGFYDSFKSVVEHNTELKSTGQFAAAHGAALRTFVASANYHGAPKVGAEIDAFLGAALGLKKDASGAWPDAALDAATKSKLVLALGDLAAALAALSDN